MKKTYYLSWFLASLIALPAYGALFSSTLPSSRSSEVGAFASFFGTVINAGDELVTGCKIALARSIGATFFYQTTDPQTNQTVGSPNTPVDINVGEAQTFLLGLTAQNEIAPTDVEFSFECDNAGPAPVITGVNTLLFSASNQPTPDIVALSATVTNDGIVTIPPGDQFGFFTVATVNVGIGSTVDVFPRATGTPPEKLLVCETNPGTGACLSEPSASVTTTIGAQATPTFAVFVAGNTPIPFDPANNRIFLDFVVNGAVRGATSVALRKSTEPFVAADSLHQAAFVAGTTTYRFGHNSVPNIEIIGAPADTDFERCAMLHDGFSYRFYCFKQQSKTTLYQFAFDPATEAYVYGFGSIPQLEITGAPLAADTSHVAMLHDGFNYRLYLQSKVDDTTLYQFAFNPETSNYEFGFNSIEMLKITGSPEDADFTRWAMLHDGVDYRFFVARKDSENTLYQFTFNALTGNYEYGLNAIDILTLVDVPEGIGAVDFSMLHDGVDYRLYIEEPGPAQPVVASLNQAAFVAPANYQFGLNSIPNIAIVNAPFDTDLKRSAMLYDGDNYRLYFFKKGSDTQIYQFAYNTSTGVYEFGYLSIPELSITGAPAAADTSRFAMLHDGDTYRLYLHDNFVAGRVHQFGFNPATSNYEYGFESIRVIDVSDAPADTDYQRWAMLHDGVDFRMYIFRSGSSTVFYQFGYNSTTAKYQYGFRSIPNLQLIGLPDSSAFNDMSMLHDGSNYRLYMLD